MDACIGAANADAANLKETKAASKRGGFYILSPIQNEFKISMRFYPCLLMNFSMRRNASSICS